MPTRAEAPVSARDDGRDDAMESRKRQLSRSPSPDRADRRSRSPEVKRARSRSPERTTPVARDGRDQLPARAGSYGDGSEVRRDD